MHIQGQHAADVAATVAVLISLGSFVLKIMYILLGTKWKTWYGLLIDEIKRDFVYLISIRRG